MADTIKSFYSAVIPTSSTNVYTVPAGKYSVIKSIIICNQSLYKTTFRLSVNGLYVAYARTIQGKSTLVIDDLDIPFLAGSITLSSGSADALVVSISGFERDYVSSDYPYSTSVGSMSSTVNLSSSYDWIVRTLIICNLSTSSATITVKVGDVNIIDSYTLSTVDSLILPSMKLFSAQGKPIVLTITGGTTYYGLIAERVVQ